MSHLPAKLLLFVLSSVMFFFLVTLSSAATDLLAQAAVRLREKDYAEAVAVARKAGDSPQRSFLLGVALLRMGKADEALPQLAEAEAKLPLLAACQIERH